jgi:hypothetical protein
MPKEWKDLGNDQWKLVVTTDDASVPPSIFYGTRDEIFDKLADSQANASQRIAQLRKNNGSPASPPAPAAPRPLSAAERMSIVAELNDPATVDKAVTRVMESAIGPVEEFRKDKQEDREARNVRTATQAAEMFFERTPDWHPSEHNKQVLVNYIKTQGLSPLDTNN